MLNYQELEVVTSNVLNSSECGLKWRIALS